MKQLILLFALPFILFSCNTNPAAETAPKPAIPADTLSYAYKASYSSDFTVPANPINAQAMRPYYANTVTYEDAGGMRFHGPTEKLLAYAKQDIAGLDSMRFDISAWQSSHSNDRNEDWVSIWSAERRYPKNGHPDTVLMQENWKVKDGLVVYFNQYLAKLPK